MDIESFSSIATIMGGGFFASFLIGYFKENYQNSYVCFWWGFSSANVFTVPRNNKCRS
jgi:hypothetical protein